jgi:sec-independent protein translocase protein TatA
MPFKLGPFELMIILTLVIIIFGVGKLPDVARNMGQAIREFRSAQDPKAPGTEKDPAPRPVKEA